MTKRYSILQKKLQELEFQLNSIFSFSEDHIDDDLSADIRQRLAFAKSLLAAEMACHPTKPQHLSHMSHRLDALDNAFLDWSGFGNYPVHHHVDEASSCSCTESCLNDDGEVSDEVPPPLVSPVYRDAEVVLEDDVLSEEGFEDDDDRFAMVEHDHEGLDEETASFGDVAFLDCLVGEKRDCGVGDKIETDHERVVYVEKGKESWFSRAVAGGMVLGMAFMGFVMTIFSGCFEDYNRQFDNFLAPT